MSDTEMDTPATSVSLNGTMKGNKPQTFSGNRKYLKTWITQCNLYFHLNDHIEESNKAVIASTYLTGDALEWITPQLERYMDDDVHDPDNANMFEDWTEFKKHLQQVFGTQIEIPIAERNIQMLRQTNSVADYTNKFKQHATIIDWDDEALKHMFRQGLKPQVQEELMQTAATITTLDNLIKESIRIDNALYELELEKCSYGKGNHRQNTGKQRDFNQHSRTRRTAGHYT